MTEIVARLPRSRGVFRLLQVAVLLAGVGLVAFGALALRLHPRAHPAEPAIWTPGEKRGSGARLYVVVPKLQSRAGSARRRRLPATRRSGSTAASSPRARGAW